jgi:hypothetical protein
VQRAQVSLLCFFFPFLFFMKTFSFPEIVELASRSEPLSYREAVRLAATFGVERPLDLKPHLLREAILDLGVPPHLFP